MHKRSMARPNKALSIRKAIFGDNDNRVADVMYKMGSSAFASGDHESASENLLKCAEIRDANSVRDSAYINVLFVIGNLYKMQDNEDEAKRWWTRGYDMYMELGMNEAKPQIGKEMEAILGIKKEGFFRKLQSYMAKIFAPATEE